MSAPVLPVWVLWSAGPCLAPLLLGLINRTKAVLAGRRGAPLLQVYYDLAKLCRKGAVFSRSTSWVFRAGPAVGLAAVLVASLCVPLGPLRAPLVFAGDLVWVAYLLGLQRFFLMLSALDTGSAFEGMGASREAWISALAEPVLFLALAALVRSSGAWSLSGLMSTAAASPQLWPVPGLAAAALFVVLLAETSRVPVGDPTTHLELTMIHEVMVLDHSGPDLALLEYAGALKLWLLGSLVVGAILPAATGGEWCDGLAGLAGLAVLAVAVGTVESVMARLRLVRVPHLLAGAGALAALALLLTLG